MKAVVALSILIVVAAMIPESEAGFFRRIKNKAKKAASKVKDTVQKGAGHVASGVKAAAGSVRDTMRDGADALKQRVIATGRHHVGFLRNLFRGKRSALTLNRVDDVNALDIATTFNLKLSAVKEAFATRDEDKSGSLDGLEVLNFLHKIEEMATLNNLSNTPKL